MTCTKRSRLRRLLRWIVRATSSLPTPLSPVISTVALVGAARPIAAITCFSAGALADHLVPDFDGLLERPVLVAQPPLVERVAEVTSTRSLANGFSMKSNAPFLVASTAVLIVPWPEMMTTGSASFIVAQPLEHLDAVHAGHLDVEQHQVRRLALGQREPLLAGRRAEELVAFVLERHPQRVADRRFVVDDQDA